MKKLVLVGKVLLGVATVVSTGFGVAAFFRGERLDKKSCDQIVTSIREQEKAEKEAKKMAKKNFKEQKPK